MKIIRDNVVYVQKNDIVFLNRTDLVIPGAIYEQMNLFGNRKLIIDDSNRFEFVKFEGERLVEYFRDLDWIVDYDSVKDLDDKQMIELGQSVAQKKNRIAKAYNRMSAEKRRENMHMVDECERLEFQINSLRDILWFKRGQLKIVLPEGVEKPTDSKQQEIKGFGRIFRRTRRKKQK